MSGFTICSAEDSSQKRPTVKNIPYVYTKSKNTRPLTAMVLWEKQNYAAGNLQAHDFLQVFVLIS